MRADVHAPSWPRHARQIGNRRSAARVITQKYADNFLHAFALDDEVIDVAFLFEDARDFQLQFRGRNIDARVFGLNRVADSRQHVGNRISHSLNSIFDCQLPIADSKLIGNGQSKIGNVLTNWISPPQGSVPAAPTRESKSGTDETCADKRAGGRTAYNGYTPATKTLACDSLSRLMISLP